MSRKVKLIGTLTVLHAVVLSYVAQVSHVATEIVAKWTLHEWVGALALVLLAGINAWQIFLHVGEKKPDGTGGGA